ncbi:MAG TPA: MaoC family dehydratase, partial [Conexibacter sp.]|nr:MaoC family dehydratase [Conexibacter sp.]
MSPLALHGVEELRSRLGQELGVSGWHEVTQEEIDAFAQVTGDDYWIHVDPDRARSTPFGSTIAHGLLTLSLGPRFSYEIYEVTGVAFGVNYGFGRVRFPAPLPVGSRVRMRATLTAVDDVPG